MVSCSVVGCGITYNCNPNQETFHRFPINGEIKKKWIQLLNRRGWEPYKNSMVCSRHFKDSCFLARHYRRILIKGSVPTEHIPAPDKTLEADISTLQQTKPNKDNTDDLRRSPTKLIESKDSTHSMPSDSYERSRLYRLRKKQLAQGIKSSANEVLHTPSTSNSRMTVEPSPQPVATDLHANKNMECRIKLENEFSEDPETEQPFFEVNIEMEPEFEVQIKNEIKIEEDILQCYICLSVGRKMFPMEKYEVIYKKLLYDKYQYQSCESFDMMPVCWECKAMLRNVETLQNRIRKGKKMLQMADNIVSLSNLTTIVFSDANPDAVYLSETNMQQIHIKKENDLAKEQEEDNKEDLYNEEYLHNEEDEFDQVKTIEEDKKCKVKKNEWAKRRVLLNRKPKFKIVDDFNEMFKNITINTEILKDVLEECKKEEFYVNSEFKCPCCIQSFDDENALNEHNNICHDEAIGIYACDICKSRFSNVQTLSSHLTSHYQMYHCKLCHYKCFSEEAKRSHIRIQHGDKALECLKCGRVFKDRREFYKHYKDEHEKFTCDYCSLNFKLKYSLINHIRKKHTKRECNICQKQFSRYNSLWVHHRVHHRQPSEAAYCVECDIKYTDIYRYKWHLTNSIKHRPRKVVRVPCPGCDKEFSKKIYMKNHFDLFHLKLIKFKCEMCDKHFGSNADLVKHRRRVHDGVQRPKDKICHICGRGFTTNNILANHVRTHTGDRPHMCAHCPARFTHKGALGSHTRSMHPT